MASNIRRNLHFPHKSSELVSLSRPIILMFWLFLSVLQISHAASDTSTRAGPATDFRVYSRVRPKIFLGRSKREILDTRENDFQHADLLTAEIELDGIERMLDLRLNTDLIPIGFKHRHQHSDGYKTETPETVELCQYQGSVRGIPNSWVAVSTCHGLRGVIFDGENMHHIHPETESLDSLHYLYNHNDLTANHTCGYERTPPEIIQPQFNRSSPRSKRAAEAVRGPYNADRQSRYIELVLVVDKREYVALGRNSDKVHNHCKDIANIVNALYTPLNIFVALVGIEVWRDEDRIVLSSNSDITLSNFLKYREGTLVTLMPNDHAHLLTRTHFDNGVGGKAYVSTICTNEKSGGITEEHSDVIGLVAATVAHEIGHNLGMEHDGDNCYCPEDRCIMTGAIGEKMLNHWSSCSRKYLRQAFAGKLDYCLRNKPKKLFGGPVCGNGFVESGEQCDCGLQENCNNPCCNAITCMFHPNASCAIGECCDVGTCRLKNAGIECRPAEHECDLPEYCSGRSEYCPVDEFKPDGDICKTGVAFCYQGSCSSHNDQCKLLWGSNSSNSIRECYDMNSRGDNFGNCGFDHLRSAHVKCQDADVLCGLLHCDKYRVDLQFGKAWYLMGRHARDNKTKLLHYCQTASVDLGLNDVDPGLVPNGAKCGPDKMCVNQKCISIATIRAGVNSKHVCPKNCGGNGVCNHRGLCECYEGFQPPDCVQRKNHGPNDSEHVCPKNCGGNGVCNYRGSCECYEGFQPPDCVQRKNHGPNDSEHFCPKNCGGNGVCNYRGSCECYEGFQPPDCVQRKNHGPNDFEHVRTKNGSTDNVDDQSNIIRTSLVIFLVILLICAAVFSVHWSIKSNKGRPTDKENAISTLNRGFPIKTIDRPSHHGFRRGIGTIDSTIGQDPACASLLSKSNNGERFNNSLFGQFKGFILTPLKPTSLPSQTQKPLEPTSPTPLPTKNPKRTKNHLLARLFPQHEIVDERNNPSRNHHHQRANEVIDKKILRNLGTSNPILQNEVVQQNALSQGGKSGSGLIIGAIENEKKVVMKAQSTRDPKRTLRPAVQTFGSMTQATSNERPMRIPASVRPTSPPPPVPSTAQKKSNESSRIPQNSLVKIYANVVEHIYDDCMNIAQDSELTKIMKEPNSSENIYADIGEPLRKPETLKKLNESSEHKVPKPLENSRDSHPMSLLSEIVSEISNRNFDLINSGSSVQKEKEEKQNSEHLGSSSSLGTHVNSNHYESPESVYSNSPSGKFDSAVSETSSGCLLPSAANVPCLEEKPRDVKVQKSQMKTPTKWDNRKMTQLDGSNSVNSNLNDELMKVFRMKSAENRV